MLKRWLALAAIFGLTGCVETFQDPAFWNMMAAASAPSYSTYPTYSGGYDDNCDGLPGGNVCQ